MNVTPLVRRLLVLLIIFHWSSPRGWIRTCRSICRVSFNPDPEVETSLDPLKVTVARSGEYTSTTRNTVSTTPSRS